MTTPLPHLPSADVDLKDARELHLRRGHAGRRAERVAARALGRGHDPAAAARGGGVLDRAAGRAPGDRGAGGDRRGGEQRIGGRAVALGDTRPAAIPAPRRRRACDGGRRIGRRAGERWRIDGIGRVRVGVDRHGIHRRVAAWRIGHGVIGGHGRIGAGAENGHHKQGAHLPSAWGRTPAGVKAHRCGVIGATHQPGITNTSPIAHAKWSRTCQPGRLRRSS